MKAFVEYDDGTIVPLKEHLEGAVSQSDLDKFMIIKKLREENDRLTARVLKLEVILKELKRENSLRQEKILELCQVLDNKSRFSRLLDWDSGE